jgi:hypothetical protein
MQKLNGELYESLVCSICLECVENPMECQICNNIFCFKCVMIDEKNSKFSNCPLCRNESNFKHSAFASRIINSIPVECPNNCGKNSTKGDLAKHLITCENKKYLCIICHKEDLKDNFLKHLINDHQIILLSKYDKNSEKNIEKQLKQVSKIMDLKVTDTGELPTENKNLKGYKCKLSTNKRYYCGKPLGFSCGCCDGNCGPDNGCCCSSCMELTVHYLNLPFGCLLNNNGEVSQFNKGNFYCGKKVENKVGGFLKKLFQKSINCVYPNTPCDECKKLKNQIIHYFKEEEINVLLDY